MPHSENKKIEWKGCLMAALSLLWRQNHETDGTHGRLAGINPSGAAGRLATKHHRTSGDRATYVGMSDIANTGSALVLLWPARCCPLLTAWNAC